MAQKEEFQAEAPIPCINNCGFFGSRATMNLCSKCFQNSGSGSGSGSASSRMVEIQISSASSLGPEQIPVIINTGKIQAGSSSVSFPSSRRPDPSRCHWCRKRIGLSTGFKCRCGDTFCSTHRYSDEHQCSFDYKAAGRESIAKANPLVIASKINKI